MPLAQDMCYYMALPSALMLCLGEFVSLCSTCFESAHFHWYPTYNGETQRMLHADGHGFGGVDTRISVYAFAMPFAFGTSSCAFPAEGDTGHHAVAPQLAGPAVHD